MICTDKLNNLKQKRLDEKGMSEGHGNTMKYNEIQWNTMKYNETYEDTLSLSYQFFES